MADRQNLQRITSTMTQVASLDYPPLPRAELKPLGQQSGSSAPRSAAFAGRFYFPELDAIRIFLFFGVWSYHTLPRDASFFLEHRFPPVLASLATTVVKACMCSLDVFFILSAFLITELLLRERDAKSSVDLKAFYVRRLLRIWPLYFFMIALAVLSTRFDHNQVFSWNYILGFLFFTGNWVMVFHGFQRATFMAPLWSVSFEEQFYLLWPLVLRKASAKLIRNIAIGLLVVAPLVRLVLLLHHVRGDALWFNTFARLDSIALGILLALAFHGRSTFTFGLPARFAFLALGISAWMLVGYYCGLLNPVPTLAGGMIGYPLMSLGGAAIFLSVLGAAQDGMSLLKNPLLVYLGKISYGLYAFHLLALQLSTNLFAQYHHPFSQTLSWLFALGMTFFLAVISYRWLESPFLRWKQKSFTHVPSGAIP